MPPQRFCSSQRNGDGGEEGKREVESECDPVVALSVEAEEEVAALRPPHALRTLPSFFQGCPLSSLQSSETASERLGDAYMGGEHAERAGESRLMANCTSCERGPRPQNKQ